jgi:hypothetical protein
VGYSDAAGAVCSGAATVRRRCAVAVAVVDTDGETCIGERRSEAVAPASTRVDGGG